MKIVDFKATTVALPMEAPLRHSAAVHPGRCIRTILQVFTDEGIVGGKMEYRNGALPVPDGPGLGIEVDEEKLREGARRYEVEGGLGFPLDPKRPLWYQKFPAW